ncbi:type II secretion system protein GspH [Caldichromatium japonicum]|uniref:Type II secretion system protein H n=2 Tax=Caldichromatium japonicum TaxID=2699430 RepID=A0A6G7VHD0_9GAMM|nr:type II secretion system protein GspH [Caldichromatium japonicum]
MAIAALIMTAMPALLSAALPGMELKSSARQTAATLRLARELAIQRGEPIAVIIDLEGHRLTLPGKRPLSIPERLDLSFEIAGSELIDAQRGTIRFFPDGSSTGGRLTLAYRGHGYQVGVAWLTGRIALDTWSER